MSDTSSRADALEPLEHAVEIALPQLDRDPHDARPAPVRGSWRISRPKARIRAPRAPRYCIRGTRSARAACRPSRPGRESARRNRARPGTPRPAPPAGPRRAHSATALRRSALRLTALQLGSTQSTGNDDRRLARNGHDVRTAIRPAGDRTQHDAGRHDRRDQAAAKAATDSPTPSGRGSPRARASSSRPAAARHPANCSPRRHRDATAASSAGAEPYP